MILIKYLLIPLFVIFVDYLLSDLFQGKNLLKRKFRGEIIITDICSLNIFYKVIYQLTSQKKYQLEYLNFETNLVIISIQSVFYNGYIIKMHYNTDQIVVNATSKSLFFRAGITKFKHRFIEEFKLSVFIHKMHK